MLEAAQLHERLHPYLYSQAVRWFHDGFPWTMAPLSLAFPSDSKTYGRENDAIRGYEWMIGDSLLAVPLYGNDYETAKARDIYLPAGTWIDYDTGQKYDGGQTLKNFALPPEKTPLFVAAPVSSWNVKTASSCAAFIRCAPRQLLNFGTRTRKRTLVFG